MSKRAAAAHAFLDWGGFAPLAPMFGAESPFNADKEDVPVDRENMRRALNMAAQLTGRPDPSFAPPPAPEVVQTPPEAESVVDLEPQQTISEAAEPLAPPPATSLLEAWTIPEASLAEKPVQRTTAPPPKRSSLPTAAANPTPKANPRKQLAKAKLRTATREVRDSRAKDEVDELITMAKRPKKHPAPTEGPDGLKSKIQEVIGKWF